MAMQANAAPSEREMHCPSCGRCISYAIGQEKVSCPYCRSEHVPPQGEDPFANLQDMANASFTVAHCPAICMPEDVRALVLQEMRDDPVGFPDPESLVTTVIARYLPIWQVEAKFRCAWHGYSSESRGAAALKHGRRSVPTAKLQMEQAFELWREEHAQLVEEAKQGGWREESGTHTFSMSFTLPGNEGHDLEHALVRGSVGSRRTQRGVPKCLDGVSSCGASVTQTEAWEGNDCLGAAEEEGMSVCREFADALDEVVPDVQSVAFRLLLLPIAVVTYSANGREYRHLVDLAERKITGDMVALDRGKISEEVIAKAAREARAAQHGVDETIAEKREAVSRAHHEMRLPASLWLALIAAFVFIIYVSVGQSTAGLWWAAGIAVVIWLVGVVVASSLAESKAAEIESEIMHAEPERKPWETFLSRNRAHLIRLLRIKYDQTPSCSQLPPADACRHAERLRALRRLELGQSDLGWGEVRAFALSLCGEAASPVGGGEEPAAARQKGQDAKERSPAPR